jgi:hypothetical protein
MPHHTLSLDEAISLFADTTGDDISYDDDNGRLRLNSGELELWVGEQRVTIARIGAGVNVETTRLPNPLHTSHFQDQRLVRAISEYAQLTGDKVMWDADSGGYIALESTVASLPILVRGALVVLMTDINGNLTINVWRNPHQDGWPLAVSHLTADQLAVGQE